MNTEVGCELPDVQVGFRKAEEPEIKLPTAVGSKKKQENSKRIFTSALLIMLKPLTVWITTNCDKFLKRSEYQTTLLVPEKPICRSRNNKTGHQTMDLFPNWVRSASSLSIVTLRI